MRRPVLRSDLQAVSNVSEPSGGKPRLCAVHYLNSVPLIWGLRHGLGEGRVGLATAPPAECAERLRQGTADLGLAPVAEVARQGLPYVPGTCISADGPVRSILLVSGKPWEDVRTLATDCNSRTSTVLAQVILKERFGTRVQAEARPPVLGDMLGAADAALVIGDAALHLEPESLPYRVLDLAEEWRGLTGLPMVFAVWAGPAAVSAPWLEDLLTESLNYGEAHLDEICAHEAEKYGVDAAFARHYLTQHVRFRLGEREKAGLAEFLRRGEELGLILREPSPAPAGRAPAGRAIG